MKPFCLLALFASTVCLQVANALPTQRSATKEQLEAAVRAAGASSVQLADPGHFLSGWTAFICAKDSKAVADSVRAAVEMRPDLSTEIIRAAVNARIGTEAGASDEDLRLIGKMVAAGAESNPPRAGELALAAVSMQPEAEDAILSSSLGSDAHREIAASLGAADDSSTREGRRRRRHHRHHVRSPEHPDIELFWPILGKFPVPYQP